MKFQILTYLASTAVAVSNHEPHLFTRQGTSSIWAGGIHTSNSVTFVTGTITLPPYKNEPSRGVSFWVGIDGATCRDAILQTGVDYLDNRVYPWYEWYPEETKFYSDGLSAKPGDKIRMTVTATSSTSGIASLENLTTGVRRSVTLRDKKKLCLRDAEWIVENVAKEGLSDFGEVRFSETKWRSDRGEGGANGAKVYDVTRSGRKQTSCSAGGDVVCKFVR